MPRNSPRRLRTDPDEVNRLRRLVRELKERDGNSLSIVAQRLGISLTTATRYYKESKQPEVNAPVTAKELRAQKRREVNQ